MSRPKKHASDAERQAAYRARHSFAEVKLDPETLATLTRLAAGLDVTRSQLIDSMVKFALLNRQWDKSLFQTRAAKGPFL
jgi:hypothetical protein